MCSVWRFWRGIINGGQTRINALGVFCELESGSALTYFNKHMDINVAVQELIFLSKVLED